MFDLTGVLGKTEDFLRRHIKPKAVKDAEKRRRERQAEEAGRRIGRAAALTGASGAGVIVYGLAVAPIGITGLVVAGAAALVAGGATLFWPSGRSVAERRKISSAELRALVLDAEDWLLKQRALLPGRLLPLIDTIIARVDDLQPHLSEINPNGTLAWEMRRLLADHLPRLIRAYNELPAIVRDTPEARQRLTRGLGTMGEELTRMCLEASHERQLDFETQGRFIDSRYKDGGVTGD